MVGVEQCLLAGPSVEYPNDLLAGVAHDPGGGVPETPAQRLGFGGGEGAGEAKLLEPAHEGVGETHNREPGAVGVDAGEREPVVAPESLSRRMLSSTWAWARMWTSRSTGWPVASV